MHILIASATGFEIATTVDYVEKEKLLFQNHEISFLVTGIGGVSTAYNLAKKINQKKPGIILQAGIAGCFIQKELGTVVAITDEVFGDLGVWEENQFKTIFDLNLTDKNEDPFSNEILPNPYHKLIELTQLDTARSISVNEITTDIKYEEYYEQKFSPVVESMEGGAFHFVCLKEKIPFLQIRSLSNYIRERDKTKWKMKEAVTALNDKLIMIISEICKHDETYFGV
ncbi:MAG: futalosine hydrolase [Bacteroidetes bacterium]|nr:futalosine hydrolase [Bacteroidota bacterium]